MMVALTLALLSSTAAAQTGHLAGKMPYTLTRAWAGFVQRADGRPFSGVRGTWSVPRIVCNRPSSSVAFWVGLGGATSRSRALEQIGTSVDCSDRAAVSYSAWYEAYPSNAVDIQVVVRPGDVLTADVRVSGTRMLITLVNDTTGASFAKQLMMQAPETDSAEWIAEAPASCVSPACASLPLAHFSRVTFVSATSTLSGRDHPLGEPQLLNELLAVGRHGRVEARPVPPTPWFATGSVLG
jgi:hypothetical protein